MTQRSTASPSSYRHPLIKEGKLDVKACNEVVVLGAGLGRTGTESLKAALEILFNSPCYHMTEVFANNDHGKWTDPSEPDWDSLFILRPDGKKYIAAVDSPVCNFAPQVLRKYPNAIVILSVRNSAEEWVDSASATIIRVSRVFVMINRLTCHLIRPIANMVTLIGRLTEAEGEKKALLEMSRSELVEYYDRHNKHMKAVVPPSQLLILKPTDGWGPLCEKLGVPIPHQPYPHSNQRGNFGKHAFELTTKALLKYYRFLILTILLIVVYRFAFGGK